MLQMFDVLRLYYDAFAKLQCVYEYQIQLAGYLFLLNVFMAVVQSSRVLDMFYGKYQMLCTETTNIYAYC